MNANDAYLIKFLSQNNVCFEIPVYQRNYDWTTENCKQLLEDIAASVKSGLRSYFIGSVVHIQEKGPVSVTGLNKIVIIDGQQRLTTVSLILLAIAQLTKDKHQSEPILNSYLLNPMQPEASKVKLKPVKGDGQVFTDIINGKEPTQANSVGRNYRFIRDALKSGVFSSEQILDGLGRLKIVEVSLETGTDNPQLIFESLNSTGLGLSHSDLVRNFILMSLSYEKQKAFYERYWIEIEKNCAFRTAEFIRDFLVIKTKKIPPKDSVYKMFKQFAIGHDSAATELLLESLLQYSKLYSYIWEVDHPSKGISDSLANLRKLGAKSVTPYLISLLEDFESKDLSEEIVVRAIDLIESFIIRRSICELPSSSLVKAFASLHRETKKVGEAWPNQYAEYLMYVLGRKSAKGRFPKNAEVDLALEERDFYQFNHSIRNFIFNALENKNKREKTNIQDGIIDGELSIEHIMPQTLSKKWREDLGSKHNDIHERYLNVLGNLTITGHNSKISNKPFREKVEHAFADSPFWLNKFPASKKTWGEEEILGRTRMLAKKVQDLWPDVDRTLAYQTDELEEHVLSEPIDVKYTNPVSIEINGNSFEADTYREVMAEFLKFVHAIDSTKLFGLKDVEKFSKCIISEDPSELKSPYEISEGLFTEGWASATTHVKNITKIAPHFGIDLDDVVITTMKERRPEIKMPKVG